MAQDFAKHRKTANTSGKKTPARAATRNNNREDNHWSWFLSGLFSGMLLCVIGYFSFSQLNRASILAEDPVSSQAEENLLDAVSDLSFYDYLPQAEVEVNVVPVELAESGEAEANPVTYLLQAGSFQDPNDADQLRARIILLGLDARIQPVSLSGRTWYRVQAGPFMGRNSVGSAENTLIENNIDPIRLRLPAQ